MELAHGRDYVCDMDKTLQILRRARPRGIWPLVVMVLLAVVGVLVSPLALWAQAVTVTQLSDTVHMLRGKGGHIAVSVGPDGVVMIDDQFAPASKVIADAIKAIDDRPIRFVINTHWHGDHTGANKNFTAVGATVVAHDKVRAQMIRRWFKDADGAFVASDAMPKLTFSESISFHLNGETIEILKVPASHTDGDAIVHFSGSDVLHMGDVFFNGLYTFFDGSSGGRFSGMIEALRIGLEIAGPDTRIVPGHGPLADRGDLERHIAQLETIRGRTLAALGEGQTLDAFVASGPCKTARAVWG